MTSSLQINFSPVTVSEACENIPRVRFTNVYCMGSATFLAMASFRSSMSKAIIPRGLFAAAPAIMPNLIGPHQATTPTRSSNLRLALSTACSEHAKGSIKAACAGDMEGFVLWTRA